MSDTDQELPRYQSHKQVWALYISGVEVHKDGSATIAPLESGYAPFQTRAGWADRFEGSEDDPGVYVIYPDGFTSWSPTEAFENGYSRVN